MPEESFFVDIDCYQQKKNGQNAFGDCFKSKRFTDEGRLLAVLSDGLGSGIKADILATMTATMILKFMEEGKDILTATEVIMNSLPICQVRKISYATFSAFECMDDGNIRIVEEGNPDFIHFRNGEVVEHTPRVITSKKFTNRHMHLYNFKLQPEDRLVFCSDGVTQAGMGTDEYKLGWRREGLIEFVSSELKRNPTISSSHLACEIVKEAIIDAKENAKINNIKNANFLCKDAGDYLVENKFDCVFVDPPRKGLDSKFLNSKHVLPVFEICSCTFSLEIGCF